MVNIISLPSYVQSFNFIHAQVPGIKRQTRQMKECETCPPDNTAIPEVAPHEEDPWDETTEEMNDDAWRMMKTSCWIVRMFPALTEVSDGLYCVDRQI